MGILKYAGDINIVRVGSERLEQFFEQKEFLRWVRGVIRYTHITII